MFSVNTIIVYFQILYPAIEVSGFLEQENQCYITHRIFSCIEITFLLMFISSTTFPFTLVWYYDDRLQSEWMVFLSRIHFKWERDLTIAKPIIPLFGSEKIEYGIGNGTMNSGFLWSPVMSEADCIIIADFRVSGSAAGSNGRTLITNAGLLPILPNWLTRGFTDSTTLFIIHFRMANWFLSLSCL